MEYRDITNGLTITEHYHTNPARVIFAHEIPVCGQIHVLIYGEYPAGYFLIIPDLGIGCDAGTPLDVHKTYMNLLKAGVDRETAKEIAHHIETTGQEHYTPDTPADVGYMLRIMADEMRLYGKTGTQIADAHEAYPDLAPGLLEEDHRCSASAMYTYAERLEKIEGGLEQ